MRAYRDALDRSKPIHETLLSPSEHTESQLWALVETHFTHIWNPVKRFSVCRVPVMSTCRDPLDWTRHIYETLPIGSQHVEPQLWNTCWDPLDRSRPIYETLPRGSQHVERELWVLVETHLTSLDPYMKPCQEALSMLSPSYENLSRPT